MSTITVTLDSKDKPLKPGETIRGSVAWQNLPSGEELEIVLAYHTEGVGTRDVEEIDSVVIPSPASTGSQSFAFKLPEGPYSFEGQLISLIWAIEAVFLDGDISEVAEFVLSPTEQPVILHAVASERGE